MGIGRAALFGIILHLAVSTAEDKLSLSLPDANHVRFVGGNFFVSCTATGKNVQRVMWTGPDSKQIINYQNRIHVDVGTTNMPGVDLVNDAVEKIDQGKYTCSANVDGTEVEKSFNLIVYKVGDFTTTPTKQFLEEGANTSTLQCNVVGDPAPRMTWFKNDVQIRTNKQDKFKVHPVNKYWLNVNNVTLEDAGNYTCRSLQVTSEISEVRNFDIDVIVYHKPFSPKKQDRESFSFLTGVVNITCEAVAQPEATFTWLKDGSVINSSDIYEIFDESHKSVLQINVEDEQMFGDYNCRAQNLLGTFERVITLEKGKQPAIPHTEIMQQGKNKLILKIQSQNQPEMPIVGYIVEYKPPGDNWSTAKKQEFKSGKPYVLKDLTPGTLYVIRAAAQNIAGLSDPSPEILKKTLALSANSAIAVTAQLPLMLLIALSGMMATARLN